VFEKEYKLAERRKHGASLAFSVRCADNSIYDSDDKTIFDNDAIESKKFKSLNSNFMITKRIRESILN